MEGAQREQHDNDTEEEGFPKGPDLRVDLERSRWFSSLLLISGEEPTAPLIT